MPVEKWMLDFDETQDECACWVMKLPKNYGGGTIRVCVYWTTEPESD